MPALQVRDFPDALYEELREYAARHHRSMAQQTVDAVARLIHDGRGAVECGKAPCAPFDSPAKRDMRLVKREEVLGRAAERRAWWKEGTPNPVEMLAQARVEHDGQIDCVIAEIMEESQK